MPDNSYFKFMCDIVRSGVWRKLTPSARTLYPALLIHTDAAFKPVYPSLRRLKMLTGLSNNGVSSGLKSLQAAGLIRIISGRNRDLGNSVNIYEILFKYEGSNIDLQSLPEHPTPTKSVGRSHKESSLPPREDKGALAKRGRAPSPGDTNERATILSKRKENVPHPRTIHAISELVAKSELHYARNINSGATFSLTASSDRNVLILKDAKNTYRLLCKNEDIEDLEFF